ncbi:unnamed protein product [Rotaria magnacalcarata]|uniref:Uncharacterized protein n=1 Tax=Rotaria magnacalcarata TaxID=392030 RepID=A0A816MGE1_9BILA|nr:unnamed protein product [Rotaria magnacalcarata]
MPSTTTTTTSTETAATTNAEITTTTTIATNIIITINTSEATTTEPCDFGYSQSPSGACVNLQINSSNCGSFGVYYNAIGSFPNRTAAFAFYASHFGQLSRYHQFQILFRKNLPGIVKFIYYQASDGGASATIGVQNSSSGLSMTYAFTQVNAMTNTMALIFGTNMDTFSG